MHENLKSYFLINLKRAHISTVECFCNNTCNSVMKRGVSQNCLEIASRPSFQTGFLPHARQLVVTVHLAMARIIFCTIIDYSLAAYKVIIFSLKVWRLNIREVRGGDVPGHWGGNSYAFYIGFPPIPTHPELPQPSNPPNPIPPALEFPPYWP